MAGQRRKRGGRVTPKGGAPGRSAGGRFSAAERMGGLEDIFAKVLSDAGRDLSDATEPLEVERWASQVWSAWAEMPPVSGMDPVAVFAGGLIGYCATRATSEALRVLRALGAVAPEPYRSKARRAAQSVAQGGVLEPAWGESLGAV